MAKPAIRVEGLWKEYVIGAQQKAHGTFYDMLSTSLAAPFRALRGRTAEEQAAESFWALRDVNFEVQPGEVIGIIGRNGAGKSTLLKVLSRITAPTRGRVEVHGRIASLLEVGTGFHPELSGRENIHLNGAILGMNRLEIARKFDEIVSFAEVERFVDTPVKRYSSGMYTRLAFSVAAHLEPDILVVDEVLAVGDADFQRKCLGKMQQSSEDGRTVVFVSHNMPAVQALCGRALLLERGTERAVGPTKQVLAQYANASPDMAGIVQLDKGRLQLIEVHAAVEEVRGDGRDIVVSLAFQSIGATKDLLIDFCLENAKGTRLFHIMPLARGDAPVRVEQGDRVTYVLRIRADSLIPGEYFCTIFAFSARIDGALLTQSNIPLFQILPSSEMPECSFENFSGALIPTYESSLTVNAKSPWRAAC